MFHAIALLCLAIPIPGFSLILTCLTQERERDLFDIRTGYNTIIHITITFNVRRLLLRILHPLTQQPPVL